MCLNICRPHLVIHTAQKIGCYYQYWTPQVHTPEVLWVWHDRSRPHQLRNCPSMDLLFWIAQFIPYTTVLPLCIYFNSLVQICQIEFSLWGINKKKSSDISFVHVLVCSRPLLSGTVLSDLMFFSYHNLSLYYPDFKKILPPVWVGHHQRTISCFGTLLFLGEWCSKASLLS